MSLQPSAALSSLDNRRDGFVRPYFVVRVAALACNAVAGLRAHAVIEALRNIASLDDEHAAQRDALSDMLHAAIGVMPDRKRRGQLLRLRRTLYQGEVPDSTLHDAAAEGVDAETGRAIRTAVDVLRSRAFAQVALQHTLSDALRETRTHFQNVLGDPDFQKGLLLSTSSLYANLRRYRAAPLARLTSRDEQVERGLLRYFTRAVMKATPFARFCAVSEGSMEDAKGGGEGFVFDADPSAKRGHVRLNKNLYGRLWSHLKSRPAFRRGLIIELNPTLAEDDGRLHYLAAIQGRELFQRLKRSAELDAVVAHVRRHPDVTLGMLADALKSDPDFEITGDDAFAYLDALVNVGLLRFRSLVAEQVAEWDAPFGAALDTSSDVDAKRVSGLLRRIRGLADRYADASVAERTTIAEETHVALHDELAALGLPSMPAPDLPLYEDASTAARLIVPRTEALEATLASLTEWVELTLPIAYPRAEQATMRHFFETRYGDVETVPLLRFYEEFHREHFKTHLEKEAKARLSPGDAGLRDYDIGNPFGLAHVQALREAPLRLSALLRARWLAHPDATTVTLSFEEVRQALESGIAPPGKVCRSVSLFSQLIPPSAAAADGGIVVPNGQYFVGFGKYFSRFLYMLPDDLQARVFDDNAALAGEEILAEICGDAHFNANLHPRLLPSEISYPTGESTAQVGQVPCSELEVARCVDDPYALQLVDRRSGRRVLPVDLGFLNPRMRPLLFQLLVRFTPGGAFTALIPDRSEQPRHFGVRRPPDNVPATPADDMAAVETNPIAHDVVCRPRFVIGDSLVIARRRWSVPGAAMPRQEPIETDSDYLLRVDRWRRRHDIPLEVYVRVMPRPGRPPGTALPAQDARAREDAEKDAASAVEPPQVTAPVSGMPKLDRPSRDLNKPQYIDFASPLLVRLFSRLPGALAQFTVQLEERYPGTAELPTFGNDAYVSELVLQLDLRAPVAVSSTEDGWHTAVPDVA